MGGRENGGFRLFGDSWNYSRNLLGIEGNLGHLEVFTMLLALEVNPHITQ